MPAFTFPIGSVLRAVTYCTAPGQVATNTLKWQATFISPGSTFSTADILPAYDNAIQALMLPCISNNANYYGTQLYLDNPIGSAPRPDTDSSNFSAGTGGAGLLPTQSSPLIARYTSTLGKQGQGRFYVPFPPLIACELNGTPSAAYLLGVGALSNYINSPQNFVSGGGVTCTLTPVLYQGGAAPALVIQSAAVRDAFATQRRRGAFGRANSSPNF